jgi:hypothetical protein
MVKVSSEEPRNVGVPAVQPPSGEPLPRIGSRLVQPDPITVTTTVYAVEFVRAKDEVRALIKLRHFVASDPPVVVGDEFVEVPAGQVAGFLTLWATDPPGEQADWWAARSARVDEYLAALAAP